MKALISAKPGGLPAVAAYQPAAGEDVSSQRVFDLRARGAGRETQRRVERVEIENIAVLRVTGRAGASVTPAFKVIAALACAIRELRLRRQCRRQ